MEKDEILVEYEKPEVEGYGETWLRSQGGAAYTERLFAERGPQPEWRVHKAPS
jgi:hypothetical protein